MIRDMVATPSVSSVNPDFDMSNKAVIDRLAEWTTALGFAVQVQPVVAKPGHYNMVATLGQGPSGLVLSGHTDTVPCDPQLWQSDPFSVTQRDDRLYGLGTTDMKSFLAMAIEAARIFADKPLKAPLTILATADEESGMLGARALVEEGISPGRFALVGEPTGLRPVRMHKGIFMEGIRIRGQSGHSSDPTLGYNAMEAMHRVMSEILTFRQELQSRYRNDAFKVPYPTLNLGHICGGDNPNRICGQCDLSIDLRPLPGMDLDETRNALRNRLRGVMADESGCELSFEKLFPGIAAVETDAGSAIVRAVEEFSGYTA
ncbi:MAG TPA: acetylornithine deacetylase, partial [Gammaproteobacteria bacterium]|nr:acetylornithine deacetylase [Gammaproteobacteria bacterium]